MLRSNLRALMIVMRSTMFFELMRRQKQWVWAYVVLGAFSSLAGILQAGAEVALVDEGIVRQTGNLDALAFNYLISSCFVVGFIFLWQMALNRLVWQVDFDLRLWVYTRLASADMVKVDDLSSGQVVTRSLTDVQQMEQGFRVLPQVIAFIPGLLGRGLFLAFVNPALGLFVLAVVPVNLWLISMFRFKLRALSWLELNERAEAANAIGEPVRGIRVVQAFDRVDEEQKRVAAIAERVYRYAIARVRLIARYDVFLKLTPALIQTALFALGGLLAFNDSLTVGTFVLAFSVVTLAGTIASSFDQYAESWQLMVAAQGRLNDVLSLGVAPTTVGEPLPPEPETGLRLRDVTVRFGDQPLFEHLDLEVPPGHLAVLTGEAGSGKTTIASLAAGLLVPAHGTVEVDGVDVLLFDAPTARHAVRVVQETPFFFADTVRANLLLGQPDGSREDDGAVSKALRLASAEDVVTAVAGGLDGTLGDRGLTLSGGQRQRLALARALVNPPRVLVLDDALSAVNPAVEVEVLQRLRRELPQLAILCISRRKGPAAIADSVADLPSGRISRRSMVADEAAPVPGGLRDKHLELIRNPRVADETPRVDEIEAIRDEPLTVRTGLRLFKGLVAIAAAALVLLTIARLTPTFVVGNLSNTIEGEDATRAGIWVRAGVIAFAGIVLALGSYVFRIYAQRFTQGLVYVARRRIFGRLARLGIDFYDREVPGKVAARVVYDMDNVLEFTSRSGFLLVVMGVQVTFALVVVLILSPTASVVILIVMIIMAALSWIFLPMIGRAYARQREQLGEVTATMEEDLAARREVRYAGAVRQRTQEFAAIAWEHRRRLKRALLTSQVYTATLQLLGYVVVAFVYRATGSEVLTLSMAVGQAVTVTLLAQQAAQPVQTLAQLVRELQRTRVSWARLWEPFDVPILPVQSESPVHLDSVEGALELDSVRFRYPGTDRVVLDDVSLRLSAGSCTALVGYTGAGKSSITKLLIRTYDPDGGQVLVDGHDLRDVAVRDYRRHVGVVPQDAFLFAGTVRSNIAYGRPEASSEEVERAAQAVGAYDVLAALPNGFDHEVKEEGRNLTGAQCQLIALARAWLTHPSVMILDEATSSLDLKLERKVLEATKELDCTVLMVTHRQSVVDVADDVLVVDAGQIVQVGTREEVVGSGGAYDLLWEAEPVSSGQ